MKKIIISIVGSMLLSLCTLEAQETDTTGMASETKKKQQARQQQDQTNEMQRDEQKDRSNWYGDRNARNAYNNEGMVIVEKDQIPSSLKQTLQDEKYAGWENATIYHNTNTGEYVIAPHAYVFDEQGREKKELDRYDHANENQPPDPREPSRSYRNDEDIQTPPEEQNRTQPDENNQNQSGWNPENQSDVNNADRPSDQNRQPQYRTEDMVEIETSQIPDPLRSTFTSESQYDGWEQGRLYHDPTTNEYVLEMEGEGAASQSQYYRFDKNGQPKD